MFMINIIKEFVEKRIGKEEDCFLIIFYQYQLIFIMKITLTNQYIFKI
jgi:hypothetical protein